MSFLLKFLQRKSEFTRIALNGILSQGFGSVLGFAWFFILGRTLPQPEFGKFLIYSAALNTASIFTAVGLQHSMAIASKLLSKEKLFSNGVFLIAFHGLVAGVVATVGGQIATQFNYLQVDQVLFVGLTTCFISIYNSTAALIRSLGQQRLGQNLGILQPFFFVLALIPLISNTFPASADTAIECYMAATFVAAFISLLALFRKHKVLHSEVSWNSTKVILNLGLFTHVGNVLKELMYRSDLYLVGLLLGASAAGQYAVVLKIVELVGRIIDPVGLTLLYYLPHAEQNHKKELTLKTIKIYTGLIILIAVPFALVSKPLSVLVFGQQYSLAGMLLQVGIFATVPLTVWKFLANYWISQGNIRLYISSTLIGAIVTVFLNLYLLPYFGVNAAPINLILAYSIATIPLYFSYRKSHA